MKFKRIFVSLMALFVLFGTVGCGVSTPPDVIKVQIGAGPFEDPQFKGCIAAGTKDNSPTNDTYVAYPTSGRDYDAGTTDGGDSGPITVVSKDNTEMAIPVRLTWDFNTECDVLEKFYGMYNRYDASLEEEDGKYVTTAGWDTVLDKVMGNTLDSTLDEVAKNYVWRDLYNNAQAQNDLQSTLDERIQDAVNEAAKGEFFININVATMKKPVPTNTELKDAIAAEQAAVARAQSAEAEAKAKEAQARAETATAKAEAAKQRAVIDGYGGFGNYAEIQAIENGLNPWQPVYVMGFGPQ